MKYLSLFSGIGGFELGIGELGDCVGYSEINKPAIKTYEEHFEHENFGDITTVDPDRLPAFDLVVGGFPCQAFSVAGKRRGFEEARGTLFFDIARILENKRPQHLVLENVKGLLNHDNGKTFQTILRVLTELGYDIEWQLLNSKKFGVPQNRERTYIVGHLRGKCNEKIFPIFGKSSQSDQSSNDDQSGSQAFIKTRHLSQNGSLISDSITLQASEIPHIIDRKRLTSMTGRGIVKKGYTGAIETRPDMIVVLNKPKMARNRLYSSVGIAPTIVTGSGGGHELFIVDDDSIIRKVTPTECERLQGFPDNWTVGSDTQRYKQCGNAVTVNVVKAVMHNLASHFV